MMLSPTTQKVLDFLFERRGVFVTNDEIQAAVGVASRSAVKVHIYYIRKELMRTHNAGKILSERAHGYKWE